jgi:hypothetical protein
MLRPSSWRVKSIRPEVNDPPLPARTAASGPRGRCAPRLVPASALQSTGGPRCCSAGSSIEAFFSSSARVALAIATFVMSAAALFAGGNLSAGKREDRGNHRAPTGASDAAFKWPYCTRRRWACVGDARRASATAT